MKENERVLKDEHRPSEIEEKKAFHGVKTSNVQHRMMNKKTNVEWRMVIERKDEHRTY
jgi:hypothetical protein